MVGLKLTSWIVDLGFIMVKGCLVYVNKSTVCNKKFSFISNMRPYLNNCNIIIQPTSFHIWTQVSSHNEIARAIVPTRALCELSTLNTSFNCCADVPKCHHDPEMRARVRTNDLHSTGGRSTIRLPRL